jgi:ketosteroid isomerase-like protein
MLCTHLSRLLVLSAILFNMTPVLAISSAHPIAAFAEAELRAINHKFVNAFAVGDGAFIEALTANDFLLISNSGDWVERAQHVQMMKQPLVRGGVAYEDVRVRLFGRVALVHGVFEATPDSALPKRVRYTDVYHWRDSRWQLVSAQNTPMRDGITSATLKGVSPTVARWSGVAPTGDEREVLRQINENYVRAYRESDVAWYDAHLARDYIVISGDGSVSDRAKALNDFARPNFANNMRSFPVSDVRIRRFDDIAIIHAENAYVLKDGRKGVSRYTDIWHLQPDGRWLCVVAHITTHKSPT